jgi:gamma-glutamylaminecyclotransferase
MCVLIYKKYKGSKVSEATIVAASIKNPHGLGILWLDTWKIQTLKSEEYQVLYADRPYVAHFRYATVGKVCKKNCHPFYINKKEVLFQNGTVYNLGDDDKVDAEYLADILSFLPTEKYADVLEMTDCRYIVANLKEKSITIFNEDLWITEGDVLYSKANVLGYNLVGVYGTLKKGFSNYNNYLSDSIFVGYGHTFDRYPLIIKGLPYLINDRGMGEYVEIDVFLVENTVLNQLDQLEGHPEWYKREMISIFLNDNTFVKAWVYFNDTIENDGEYHKSYVQNSVHISESLELYYPESEEYSQDEVEISQGMWASCICENPTIRRDDFTGEKYCIECLEDIYKF